MYTSACFVLAAAATLAATAANSVVFGPTLDRGYMAELHLNGGTITISEWNRGNYNGADSDALSSDYLAARPSDPGLPSVYGINNFFVFDLGQRPGRSPGEICGCVINGDPFAPRDDLNWGPVTDAFLRIGSIGVSTSELYTLYDIVGDQNDLIYGLGGLAAFADLGSGNVYGSRHYTPADTGTIQDILLNAAFLADINAALGGSGRIGIGGSVIPVPEPAPLTLLGAGLAGIGVMTRHRCVSANWRKTAGCARTPPSAPL